MTIQAEYEISAKEYMDKNRMFMAGQAGILAESIRIQLEELEHVNCPVCGSVVERNHLDGLAVKETGVPTQDEVESLREKTEKRREAAAKCARECEVHKNALEIARKETLSAAEVLWGETPEWNQVQYQAKKQELNVRKNNLLNQKNTMEKEVSEVESNLKRCREELSHQQGQLKTLQLRQETVTKELEELIGEEPWLQEITDIAVKTHRTVIAGYGELVKATRRHLAKSLFLVHKGIHRTAYRSPFTLYKSSVKASRIHLLVPLSYLFCQRGVVVHQKVDIQSVFLLFLFYPLLVEPVSRMLGVAVKPEFRAVDRTSCKRLFNKRTGHQRNLIQQKSRKGHSLNERSRRLILSAKKVESVFYPLVADLQVVG